MKRFVVIGILMSGFLLSEISDWQVMTRPKMSKLKEARIREHLDRDMNLFVDGKYYFYQIREKGIWSCAWRIIFAPAVILNQIEPYFTVFIFNLIEQRYDTTVEDFIKYERFPPELTFVRDRELFTRIAWWFIFVPFLPLFHLVYWVSLITPFISKKTVEKWGDVYDES